MKDKKAKSRKNPLILFISIAIAVIVVLGIVLGTVAIVRNARAVVKYKNVSIDRGVLNYLAATFKSSYITYLTRQGIDAFDSELFWNSEATEGVTYLDLLERETLAYVKGQVAGAYLFDRVSGLTGAQKRAVKKSCEDFLDINYGGSEERFNAEAEKMGFDYEDMYEATLLLYKNAIAISTIYGSAGATLRESGSTADLEYVLSQYSHVGVLIIRNETEYLVDSEGNRVVADGKDQVYQLSDAEKAEREADVLRIRELINGYENDLDEQMSEVAFKNYLTKYDYGYQYDSTGYYFSPMSEYSTLFAEYESEDIVKTALEMKVGEYKELELDFGTCFIYRYKCESGAYLNSSISEFFTDFYADGAVYLFNKATLDLSGEVTVKDEFYDIDLAKLPYNWELVVKVGE